MRLSYNTNTGIVEYVRYGNQKINNISIITPNGTQITVDNINNTETDTLNRLLTLVNEVKNEH